MRYLSWLLTLPITVAVVLFAISNRDPVTLRLWPFPDAFAAPVYLAGLLVLFGGFLLGGLAAWMSGRPHRLTARTLADRADRLERELRDAREQLVLVERRLAESSRPATILSQLPALPPPPIEAAPDAVSALN